MSVNTLQSYPIFLTFLISEMGIKKLCLERNNDFSSQQKTT